MRKLRREDKVILTCDESDFENQESRRDCIGKLVTISEIYYDRNNNIDTFFVEENKYEWTPENISIRITEECVLSTKDLINNQFILLQNSRHF